MAEPARVEVVGPFGERGSVDASDLPAVVAQKGRALSQEELNEERFGGTLGQVQAATIGAVDTATMGGYTAALAEGGQLLGGAEGRLSVEDQIRNIEQTNPIAHTLGQVAPLLAVPEAGGEKLLAGMGESALARGARFALPELARGAAETAYLDGTQGIHEGILDHDLAAESFYVHAMKPETLYGGLLNVGVASGFKGLGKLASGLGRQFGGRVGEAAANDALLFDDVVRSVQTAGGTTDDATAAIRDVQGLAERRAALPAESRGMLDSSAESLIKMHSGGNPETARRLARIYKDGSRVTETIDNELTGLATKADTHIASMMNDLSTMERERASLKFQNVKRMADPSRISAATDAANGWVRELEATFLDPAMPPAPRPPKVPRYETLERRYLKDPALTSTQAKQFARAEFEAASKSAEEAFARESAAHAEEIARLQAERMGRIDPVILETISSNPATRVGMSAKDQRGIRRLIDETRREISLARQVGGAEGVARIHAALDDGRQIFGKMADFGKMHPDVAARIEQHLYNNRLKPMLEDSNLWGSGIADLQKTGNEAVADSIKAVNKFRASFLDSTEQIAGQRVYSSASHTKGFIEGLGTYENGLKEQVTRQFIDAARARGAAMLKTMDLSPAARAAIERAGQNATDLEKLLEQARSVATDAREIKALKARESSFGPSGIVGKLLGFATSPARSLEALGNFRKAESEVRKLLTRESNGFIKGESVPAVKPMLQEAERKAAMQSIRDVQRYATDPRSLAVAIKDSIGDMPETSPQMAGAVATTIARGVLALAKRAPQPLPARFSDKPGETRYASGELERYWRDKQLVERPPVVMQLMRSGQLHQEDIVLMKEVIPRLFAQMQLQLELDVQKARESGALRSMSYQEQLALSWMLGRPLDATQDPGFVSAMQESAANDPMNQAHFGKAAMGGGRPSKANQVNFEEYRTLEERLEA